VQGNYIMIKKKRIDIEMIADQDIIEMIVDRNTIKMMIIVIQKDEQLKNNFYKFYFK